MEKRTIGGFIATLRKANGMTQKQLAEKLCVSDKTVSRWERDECAPDLSLIPVIAEIFSITTDELLRGQRNNPDTAVPANAEAKSDLQRRRMLKDAKTKYRIRSLISVCVAVVGFIAALICNFGFLRAYIAFGIGAVFCVIAAIAQAVFTVSACAAVDSEDVEESLLTDYRMFLFSVCRNISIVILVLLAILLPMTMAGDAYWGIEFGSWLGYGLVFGALALILSLVCACLILLYLVRSGVLSLGQQAVTKTHLKLRCIAIFITVSLVLLLVQSILNAHSSSLFVSGTTFDSWEEFKTYMETPDNGYSYVEDGVYIGADALIPTEPVPEESIPAGEDNAVMEDEGSIIYYEPYQTEQVAAEDGTVLCEFTWKNQNVSTINYNFEHSEDGLPVTVYTYDDFRQVNVVLDDLVNPLFMVLYAANALLCTLFYIRKAKEV